MEILDRVPGNPEIETPLHPRAHLSDYLTAWEIRKYGQRKYSRPFPGPRVVLIGRGGYDEHPEPNLKEVEATLAAKDLGIADLPELRELLEYTLMVDGLGHGKGVLKFGRLVELLHNILEPERVRQWTELVFDAFVFSVREWDRFSANAPNRDMVWLLICRAFQEAAQEFPHEATKRRLWEEVVVKWSGNGLWQPFSLPHCMAVVGAFLMGERFAPLISRRTRIRLAECSLVAFAADAFRAELEWQCRYFAAAADHEKARPRSLTVRGKELVVYFVSSDHHRIHSRLFKADALAALAMVRRSSGQVQIFRRRGASIRVSTKAVAAFLRDREMQKAGEPQAQWSDLASPLGPAGAGQRWFYHEKTEGVFNGGLTAPEITPTALRDEEIEDALVRGIDDAFVDYRKEFYRERSGVR